MKHGSRAVIRVSKGWIRDQALAFQGLTWMHWDQPGTTFWDCRGAGFIDSVNCGRRVIWFSYRRADRATHDNSVNLEWSGLLLQGYGGYRWLSPLIL
jgi:hypothetical protein